MHLLRVLIVLVAVAASPAGRSAVRDAVPAEAPAFAKFFEGRWDEGGSSDPFCAPGRNLRKISPSTDGKSLLWQLDQEVDFLDGRKTTEYRYKVVDQTGTSLTLVLDGETRKNSRGELFTWELVVVGPGRMRWRSTDFEFGVYNNVWLVKCER